MTASMFVKARNDKDLGTRSSATSTSLWLGIVKESNSSGTNETRTYRVLVQNEKFCHLMFLVAGKVT